MYLLSFIDNNKQQLILISHLQQTSKKNLLDENSAEV